MAGEQQGEAHRQTENHRDFVTVHRASLSGAPSSVVRPLSDSRHEVARARHKRVTRGALPMTAPSRDLETFPNPYPQRAYDIAIACPEFTSLCPITGQPD